MSRQTFRSLTGSHSLCLPLVPAKIQKGPDNTKARKGATVTLTAEILGEPAPDVGWTKDGKDIEEDDRRGRGPAAARAGPGAGENPRERDEGGALGSEEQSWPSGRARGARNLTCRPAPPLVPLQGVLRDRHHHHHAHHPPGHTPGQWQVRGVRGELPGYGPELRSRGRGLKGTLGTFALFPSPGVGGTNNPLPPCLIKLLPRTPFASVLFFVVAVSTPRHPHTHLFQIHTPKSQNAGSAGSLESA